jgi:hypothetical protein
MRSLVRAHSDDRRIRRMSLAVGVSLALTAGSVMAEKPNAAVTDSKGIMTFPNVRVINAPEVATPSTTQSATTRNGLKAYIDSNGNLRPQTAEEAIQEASATKTKVQARSLNRTAARSASLASEPAAEAEFVAEGGSTGLNVGDEQAVFMVVKKTPSGLVKSEHTGMAAAENAVKSKTRQMEVRNDR